MKEKIYEETERFPHFPLIFAARYQHFKHLMWQHFQNKQLTKTLWKFLNYTFPISDTYTRDSYYFKLALRQVTYALIRYARLAVKASGCILETRRTHVSMRRAAGYPESCHSDCIYEPFHAKTNIVDSA